MPIFGMDQWLVDRIARMLRWFESRPADSDNERPQVPNWQAVRITGDLLGGSGDDAGSGCSGSGLGCIDERDFYPGIVVAWSAPDCVEVEYGEVWVLDRNNAGLTEGQVVPCMQSGDAELDCETRTVFVCLLAGLGTEETGSDSGSDSGSGECAAGEGRSRTITFVATTCDNDTGMPCSTTTTLTFPMEVGYCISDPDCSTSGS